MHKTIVGAIFLLLSILVFSCQKSAEVRPYEEKFSTAKHTPIKWSETEIQSIVGLPLKCVTKPYPYKSGHVTGDSADLRLPIERHPSFYGCFDWHSSVHGHWVLVWTLKNFPHIPQSARIKKILRTHLSADRIAIESAYLDDPNNRYFERTYGWAWFLKLAQELESWDDPLGKELAQNIRPMTEKIELGFLDYLPKLLYPIRVGTHSNTAFALGFAYDYAENSGNDSLKYLIKSKSIEFYGQDRNCPIDWEPSGHDFLSPCLEEIDLMSRILDNSAFALWLSTFIPEIDTKEFELKPAQVADRNDGHLVHLDGLNFSRAWCIYRLAYKDEKWKHLSNIANAHLRYSLPNIIDGQYEGEHWLGTFALYALIQADKNETTH